MPTAVVTRGGATAAARMWPADATAANRTRDFSAISR
ncbi:hypothetical protein MGAST_08345 [Mycobacterium gastri 'Wayne']|nr:hypothetical protein MGAST_08345 [Mycobacterium gastri 'Wayne']